MSDIETSLLSQIPVSERNTFVDSALEEITPKDKGTDYIDQTNVYITNYQNT